MKKIFFLFAIVAAAVACSTGVKQQPEAVVPMTLDKFETIALPAPDTLGGIPLLAAMQHRKTDRQFDEKNLSLKHLSEILWAANGVNRPDGKRTVPSAMAKFPIITYAFLANGVYLYSPENHTLMPVIEGDFRELTGMQPFVKIAPLNLVFIADYTKYGDRPMPAEQRIWFASLDAGHCCQNVYLYCASAGLRSVERAMADGAKLLELLELDPATHQFIISQTVGY
ncbi:MAG: SagB/ThcOx family dehydrogenase [Paludibacter sp.]|jgi:nitroreductase|nr:SagB/ThcOx family dehydrogenase [Paludibacter sp.]